jgi:hypothetical protein
LQVSKVNPHSNQLVQYRYILQGETTQDRLARPIGTIKQKTLEEIEKPTFKPTLNPVSLEMTANNGYNNGISNATDSSSDLTANSHTHQAAFKAPHALANYESNTVALGHSNHCTIIATHSDAEQPHRKTHYILPYAPN